MGEKCRVSQGNGERVTREAVRPRMSHEAAVGLTGQPRCPLMRMLRAGKTSDKMLGGAVRGGW